MKDPDRADETEKGSFQLGELKDPDRADETEKGSFQLGESQEL